MKASDIIIRDEYHIDPKAVQEQYGYRGRNLGDQGYYYPRAVVIEKGVRREGQERANGVRIRIVNSQYGPLERSLIESYGIERGTQMVDGPYAQEFIIPTRWIIESVTARQAREALAAQQRAEREAARLAELEAKAEGIEQHAIGQVIERAERQAQDHLGLYLDELDNIIAVAQREKARIMEHVTVEGDNRYNRTITPADKWPGTAFSRVQSEVRDASDAAHRYAQHRHMANTMRSIKPEPEAQIAELEGVTA